MNEQHKIDAIAVWPVHVGGGDEHKLDPLSYVVKDSADGTFFYRINISAMMDTDRAFASEFVKITDEQNAIARLRPLIYKAFNPSNSTLWTHRASVSKAFKNAYDKNLTDLPLNNQLLVQCMPCTNGQVYIPGSSIKGSIRTAMLDYLAAKEGYENVCDKVANSDSKKRSNAIEEFLLKYEHNKVQFDPFKVLKISDAFLPKDATQIVQVFNVYDGKETRSMSMFVEAIKPETNFSLGLSINNNIPQEQQLLSNFVKEHFEYKKLMRYCTKFYYSAIMDEAERFYNSEAIPSAERVARIDDYLYGGNEKILPGIALLRVGRFSHLESMSYNNRGEGKLCQPFDRKSRMVISEGKTRNLIDGKFPLGAIVLKYA
jgi:CRISPR-associated protein Csm5